MISVDHKQELAETLGIPVDTLRTAREALLDQIVRDGVLVHVHVGRWRATHQLSAEDLGLPPHVAASLLRQIRLGTKLLLPKALLARFDRLEARARHNLVAHSIDTTLGPFVRAAKFAGFRSVHDAIGAEYLALRDDLVLRLDDIRRELERIFADAARALYPQVRPYVAESEATFVESYVSRAFALYPSRETIHASFYFTYEVTYVPLTQDVVAQEVQRANLVRDPALRQALAQHLRERSTAAVDAFLTRLTRDYRALVHRTAARLEQRLGTRERIRSTAVSRLRGVVAHLRDRDPYGDPEVRGALGALEEVLRERAPRRRAVAAAVSALSRLTASAADDTLQLEPLLARFQAIALA